MQDVHQAIAHGLAQELRPPQYAALKVEKLETERGHVAWQINCQQNTHNGWTACYVKLYLRESGIEIVDDTGDHNRPSRTNPSHTYPYEDPQLIENLQAALNAIKLPADPITDMAQKAIALGEPGITRFTP